MDRVAEVTGVLEKEPKKPKEVVCDPESGERSLSAGSTGSTPPGWTSLGLGGHLAFFYSQKVLRSCLPAVQEEMGDYGARWVEKALSSQAPPPSLLGATDREEHEV